MERTCFPTYLINKKQSYSTMIYLNIDCLLRIVYKLSSDLFFFLDRQKIGTIWESRCVNQGEENVKKIFGILLLFGLIGAAFYQILNQDEKPAGAKVGGPAADFTLEDLEGNKVSLSDYEGKKIFLNFWATWCEPCKQEMPEMEKIHQNYEDVVVLAINLDTEKDIQGFMDEHDLTFQALLDVEEEVNDQYEVVSIPTSYFIDEEGVIRKKIVGVLDYEKMEENIEAL